MTSGGATDLIDLIFTLDGEYGDNLPYWFFPENTQEDDWNSNSYAHGLLNALTASDANVGFNFAAGGAAFPGWVTPVALAQFGIDEEEE